MTNLKFFREKLGLSQSQLALKSGVSVRMIQNYEQKTKNINNAAAITVWKISVVLGCKMEDLIEK
ncbi:MAG: helix-turn-helix domain-containing protein [bacterium]|nr:helix-turn-helix domain-containing protein [bacterium]